jgi:hypothetical protein
MSAVRHALGEGFRRVERSFGLVLLVVVVNLAFAALLALPLSNRLASALESRDAASNMMYGFDQAWWSRWVEQQGGFLANFRPDILGSGFSFRNLDLLLKGELPLRLFKMGTGDEEPADRRVDALILELGFVYLLVQAFLAGGLLGVFRAPQGSWTVRGLLHGSGFYFGRLFRVTLVALAAAYLVFLSNLPLARWADRRAHEAVAETTALAWVFGRHLLLLLALLLVNLLSGYAKAIVVIEERSSALLAFLSALGFCLRRWRPVVGHYLAIVIVGLVLLWGWSRLDGAWTTTGYKTQLATLLLMQAFVVARVALRLTLMAGQVALYRKAA